MKYALLHLVILLIIASGGCSQIVEDEAEIVTILSTDLSLDRDPDDWFDTYLFLTLESINPIEVIMENYATDTVRARLKEFMQLLYIEDIAIKKGIQDPLNLQDDKVEASQHHAGADFILETMENASGKVRLIAVGSLRNEAYAYMQKPTLFKEKIDKIYFAGGTTDGVRDVNVKRDTLAAQIIINSDIPLVWIPVSMNMKQKLSAAQERKIADCGTELCRFFTNSLEEWRKYRGDSWLAQTNQLEGKNLWSLPAFSHLVMPDAFDLKFASGTMHFQNDNWTWFEENHEGVDLMLTEMDSEKITVWITELIVTH